MQYLEYEAADFLSVQLIPLTVCEKVYAPFLISTFFFFCIFATSICICLSNSESLKTHNCNIDRGCKVSQAGVHGVTKTA